MVLHLEKIYRLLQHHDVPNVDRILFSKPDRVFLTPRGNECRPETLKDLWNCLRCLLETLIVRGAIS